MKPKISIVIPTFDRAYLLNQALQSVANQTIKPYEVIIVDNASTDNTRETVNKFKKYGFKYVRNRSNIGPIRNWLKAFSLAKGEYVTMLPSDDMIAPNWHEEWLRTIPKHKSKFYTSSVALIDDKNEILYVSPTFTKSQMIRQPHVLKTFWDHYSAGFASVAANIYHKSIFTETKLYDATEGAATDIRHGIVLASKYDVYYLHKYLFTHRVHAEQTFATKKQKKSVSSDMKITDTHFGIIKEMYEKILHSSKKDRYFIQLPVLMYLASANINILRGRWGRVKPTYAVAWKHFPDILKTPSDWIYFTKLHVHLLNRGITFHRIPQELEPQFEWLKTISQDVV